MSFLCLPSISDLSEQIKAATKDNHVRAENTQLMLSYQKGQITLPQYKVNPTREHICVLQDRSHHTFCSLCFHCPEKRIVMSLSGPAVLPL